MCVCVRVHLHVCTHWYEGQELRWVPNLSPPLWLGYLANQELPGICLSGAISLPSAGLQACTAVPGFHEGPEIRTQFLILAQQTPLTGPSPCPSTFSNFFPPRQGLEPVLAPALTTSFFARCVCVHACPQRPEEDSSAPGLESLVVMSFSVVLGTEPMRVICTLLSDWLQQPTIWVFWTVRSTSYGRHLTY